MISLVGVNFYLHWNFRNNIAFVLGQKGKIFEVLIKINNAGMVYIFLFHFKVMVWSFKK